MLITLTILLFLSLVFAAAFAVDDELSVQKHAILFAALTAFFTVGDVLVWLVQRGVL